MSTFEFAADPAGRVAARNERPYRDPVGLGARSDRSVAEGCREVRGSRLAGSLPLAKHSTSGWVASTSGVVRGESA